MFWFAGLQWGVMVRDRNLPLDEVVLDVLLIIREWDKKFREIDSQCGKIRIFLSLRSYVKSIQENVRVQEMPILLSSGLWNYDFGTFQHSENAYLNSQKIRATKCIKNGSFLGHPKFLKLISRINWVIEK